MATTCALCGATREGTAAITQKYGDAPCCEDGSLTAEEFQNGLQGNADMERESKLDAERVTWEFATKSNKKLDRGRRPIEESPLFGGEKQESLF